MRLQSYSYRWADDHRRGAEEGLKNRPCLVSAKRRNGESHRRGRGASSHSPPTDQEAAVELPAVTKRVSASMPSASWIICNEANVVAWSGPDLRSAAGRTPLSIWYGPLPPKLATAKAEGISAGPAACDACRARVTDPYRPAATGRGESVGTWDALLVDRVRRSHFSALGSLICGFAINPVLRGGLSIVRGDREPASL